MTGEFEIKMKGLIEASETAYQQEYNERSVEKSVIEPFIEALQFNLSDIKEVATQYKADMKGVKQPKQVDWVIMIDEDPIMLIENKAARVKTDTPKHHRQLSDYFRYVKKTGGQKLKIGILTNGVEALFYSNLGEKNSMDAEPFFKFNFQKNTEEDIKTLKMFLKEKFKNSSVQEIDNNIMRTKKYNENSENTKNIKKYIKKQIKNPDADFASTLWKSVNSQKQFSEAMKKPFHSSIKKALTEIITEEQKIENTSQHNNKPSTKKPKVRQENKTNHSPRESEIFAQNYWKNLKEYIETEYHGKNKFKLKFQKPPTEINYNFTVGVGGFSIRAKINASKKIIETYLYIEKRRKHLFEELFNDKDNIEGEIDKRLEWKSLPENKTAKIFLEADYDPKNKEDWENQFKWFKEKLEVFNKTFSPRIDKIKNITADGIDD